MMLVVSLLALLLTLLLRRPRRSENAA